MLIENLNNSIIRCKKCPRLVKFRKKISIQKRKQFMNQTYWGKPITGFGDIKSNGEDIYVLINASNYHYRGLGVIGYFKIGPKDLIRSDFDETKLRNFFTLGILLIVAIIHLGIFFQRKEDKGSLWFSFFCFIMLFRFLSIKSYFDVLFPYPSNFSFYFNRKVEFMSFYFGGPIFLEFLRYLFKDYIPKALMKLLWSTSTFFGLIVLFTSPPVFYKTLNAYQIITLLTLLYMMTQMNKF
mgnify:CR=1 FL=1